MTRPRPREAFEQRLAGALRRSPAVAILGPRQCGKSTLAGEFARKRAPARRFVRFDLERPSELARLSAAPEEDLGELQRRPGLIVIDEVQRAPSLFPLLRVLLDEKGRRASYLLLGSASPGLMAGVSESLAGRLSVLDLTPFLAAELAAAPRPAPRERLWSRGGFPRSLLAASDSASLAWREDYIRLLLEQDIPGLGLRLPAMTLHRFWTMLAHLHGGLLNASELAAGLGVSPPTIARYLDVLEGTFMVRRLQPYWANVGKRLAKAPKVYVRDSGILHALLGVPDMQGLRGHPKLGASFEGWAIEQVLGSLTLAGETPRPYFWRTHGGAEVDLVVELKRRLIPVEIKLGGAPAPTRGLLECMKDLRLDKGFVLHGGQASFPLGKGVHALSIGEVARPNALRRLLLTPDQGRA